MRLTPPLVCTVYDRYDPSIGWSKTHEPKPEFAEIQQKSCVMPQARLFAQRQQTLGFLNEQP